MKTRTTGPGRLHDVYFVQKSFFWAWSLLMAAYTELRFVLCCFSVAPTLFHHSQNSVTGPHCLLRELGNVAYLCTQQEHEMGLVYSPHLPFVSTMHPFSNRWKPTDCRLCCFNKTIPSYLSGNSHYSSHSFDFDGKDGSFAQLRQI
jgi:hypothetical protein